MQLHLSPYGPLSRDTAPLLIAELEKYRHRGYDYFVIDAGKIEPLLLEGLIALRYELQRRRLSSLTLKMAGIASNVAAFLRMYGYPLRGDSLLLHGNRPHTIDCGHCQTSLRLQGAGKYACPACNGLFTISEEGEIQLPEERESS